MKDLFIISVLLVLMIFSGCSKEKIIQIDYKYDYYPMEVGKSWTYSLDSTLYSDLFPGGKETRSWLYRETVESVFVDNEGRDAYRIERHVRKTANDPWSAITVWYAVPGENNVERLEDNLRFIKFVFPAREGSSWDGNAYIHADDTLEFYAGWNYVIESIDQPVTFDNFNFDMASTVLEVDDENKLERRYSTARYARGVGMYYRKLQNLSYVGPTIPPDSIPWEEKANRGYTIEMRLKSFQ